MKILAYAKINLGLYILDKRKDGYHNIQTVFHRVEPHDILRFASSNEIILQTNHSEIPTDARNLCFRAALLMREQFDISQGVKIFLEKNIPIGAGLGGGSSDAASTLLALANFWNLSYTDAELHNIALQLGSDVPYFLRSQSALATGRGEQLEYFDLDIPYWILVVYQNIHVATAWAYSQYKAGSKASSPPSIKLKEIIQENIRSPRTLQSLIKNDFEEVVFKSYPDIAALKKQLLDDGAHFVELSGSGSAVYGFFTSKEDAQKTISTMSRAYKTFLTPPHFSLPKSP